MEINKAKIKKRIQRAIEKLPTYIELKRIDKIGPEYDYEEKEVPVASFPAFLDRSKSAMKQEAMVLKKQGDVKSVAKISILLVWDESFVIQEGDFFYLDGLKHVIVYPKNNFDIYWECDVEVVVNEQRLHV